MKKSFKNTAENAEPQALEDLFDNIKPDKVSKKTVSDITARVVDNEKKEKKPVFKRIISVAAAVVCLSLIFVAVIGVINRGGASSVQAADLMEGIEPRDLGQIRKVDPASAAKAADFAVRLFKQTAKNDSNNVLISPLSVLSALAMTQNGASGETLKQMEQTLGMGADEINAFFRSYLDSLKNGENCKFELANSIWFKDVPDFSVKRGFLQKNADYYGAGAYKVPFDDSTLRDINGWVNKKTDGMIKEILDKIPDDAVMYLINALCFDAEWDEKYDVYSVNKRTFTTESGEKRRVTMMSNLEDVYFDDGKATGFLKYYKGKRYAFVAMLPNEGVTVDEYISSLDGQAVYEMLSNPEYCAVSAWVPKFEIEYGTEMSDVLKAMGMTAAFDASADFSGMSDKDLLINRVIHKTFISVTETGTRAGAATLVEMSAGAMIEEIKEVHLDRPFVYMLVDTETNIPFFIGTVTDVGK